MNFLDTQITLLVGIVIGIIVGLIAGSFIFAHYHHCINKCAVEGCLKDGNVRTWSDQHRYVIYICDSHSGTGLGRQGLRSARDHAKGFLP